MTDNSVHEIFFEIVSESEVEDDESDDYFDGDGSLMKKIKKEKRNGDQQESGRKSKQKEKPSLEEKAKLAGIIRKERTLWDVLDERYTQANARTEAWIRVSNKMPGRTIDELKTMWRSLKDLARYRKKRGDDFDWELKDELFFLLSRKRQYSDTSDVMDSTSNSRHFEEPSSSPTVSINCVQSKCPAPAKDSDLPCQTEKDNDPLTSVPRPILNVRRTSSLIASGEPEQQQQTQQPLKHAYVWQHLERIYQKLSDADIEELNVSFINQAYEKTKSK